MKDTISMGKTDPKRDAELAIHGGQPVRTAPWLDNFTTGEEEKQAVCRVLDSGYLSLFEGAHAPEPPFSFYGGPRVQELESRWADHYNARFAVGMNSATSGLYAAVGALGLGYGDEVIVSPYTMSACAVCVLMYGAIPIFADVIEGTGCLDPASIDAHVTPRTRAILVVHQFGIPADMDAIMRIAKKHKLRVIEDCAQAHGAKWRERFVGTIGDIGVFSLNVNKTIQTGEGCVCTTNDEELRYRLCLIRNHGEAVVEAAGYHNIENILGFNFRPTEIQAAIAIEQLKKLDGFNAARLGYVRRVVEGIADIDFLLPLGGTETDVSTYYVLPLRYIEETAGADRSAFVRAAGAEGIKLYPGYVRPLYLQPLYQRKLAFKHGYPFSAPENRGIETNYAAGACPVAEKLHFHQMVVNEHVRLPHTMKDMDDIVDGLRKVARNIKSL